MWRGFVERDLCVDLRPVLAVVGDGGLDETHRDAEVLGTGASSSRSESAT